MKYLYFIDGFLLLLAAVEDFKEKEIKLNYILAIAVIGMSYLLLSSQRNIADVIGGVAIGLIMIVISILSDGQIGKGDGMIMSAVGLMVGFRTGLIMLCIASLIQSFISIIMLCTKKGNKRTAIPFVPSLLAGYIGSVLMIL